MFYDTNTWAFFAGHKISIDLAACHNGTYVKWAKNPNITFPSTGPWGATEDLQLVSGPTIVSVTGPCNSAGTACQTIKWKFSVKQTVAKIGTQTFNFTVAVYPAGNQICSSNACDDRELWG